MKTIAGQLNVKEFPFVIKDTKGNEIYFENSNGFWYKWEYDSDGNKIYYENSNGGWVKREYDSNGKEIYYENSNGTIIDNRPTCNNKVVEIDGKKYKLVQI
jgi:hypothetical protein